MIMAKNDIEKAFDEYREGANKLVRELLPEGVAPTHDRIIACMIIQKTGEAVYKHLKEMGYIK